MFNCLVTRVFKAVTINQQRTLSAMSDIHKDSWLEKARKIGKYLVNMFCRHL